MTNGAEKMNGEGLNRKIHEAMGRGCYHEKEVVASGTNEGNVLECKHCGAYYPPTNPAYDSDISTTFELVEWMRRERELFFELNTLREKWYVEIFDEAGKQFGLADHESLPTAIALAAAAALQIETEGGQP